MRYAANEPTPIECADHLKKYFEGKVVYELGSGYGQFAHAISKYAKQVIAIESDELVLKNAYLSKGVQTIFGNFMENDLSKAEAIYSFMSWFGMCALTNKLSEENWHGTVVSHYYPMHTQADLPLMADEVVQVNLGYGRFTFLIYHL